MSTSPWLTNSKRRHEKRTYTPLTLKEAADDTNPDAVGLASNIRSLMLTGHERAQLRDRRDGGGAARALEAIGKLSDAASAYGVLAAASDLTTVSRSDLQRVARALVEIRSDTAQNLTTELQRLNGTYLRYSSEPTSARTPRRAIPAVPRRNRSRPWRVPDCWAPCFPGRMKRMRNWRWTRLRSPPET